MRRPLRAAVFSAFLAAAPGSRAQAPTPEEVRRAGEEFEQGKRALEDEQFEDAAVRFEAADAAAPSAVALAAAIHSREQAGQLDRAATLAALVEARHPDDPKITALATKVLGKARSTLFALTVECDEPCDVVVGTRLQHGGALEERVIWLEPGRHVVRAGWSEKRTGEQTVMAQKGASSRISFEAPPVPEAEPVEIEPEEREPRGKRAPRPEPAVEEDGLPPSMFWIGAALTGVGAGLTTWSGIDTRNTPGPDAVREKCIGLGESCPEYQDGLRRQTRTNVLIGVTGALAVVTIVIGAGFTSWGSSEGEAARVDPWVAAGGGGLAASGRF